MKAARRRNSGTGDEEKGWKRSSSLSLNGACSPCFAAAPATASGLAFDVKSRTTFPESSVGFARFDWDGVVAWRARIWWCRCTAAGIQDRPTFRARNCLRRDAVQFPHRLEAVRRSDGSILQKPGHQWLERWSSVKVDVGSCTIIGKGPSSEEAWATSRNAPGELFIHFTDQTSNFCLSSSSFELPQHPVATTATRH